MARFWDRLTEREAQEYIRLFRKIAAFVGHCEACRKAKLAIDESLRPMDLEFFRWNDLFWKFWGADEPRSKPVASQAAHIGGDPQGCEPATEGVE